MNRQEQWRRQGHEGIEHEWGSGEQCLGEHTSGVATSVQDNKIAAHGASPTS